MLFIQNRAIYTIVACQNTVPLWAFFEITNDTNNQKNEKSVRKSKSWTPSRRWSCRASDEILRGNIQFPVGTWPPSVWLLQPIWGRIKNKRDTISGGVEHPQTPAISVTRYQGSRPMSILAKGFHLFKMDYLFETTSQPCWQSWQTPSLVYKSSTSCTPMDSVCMGQNSLPQK